MCKPFRIHILFFFLYAGTLLSQESDPLFTFTVPIRLSNLHPSLVEVECVFQLKRDGTVVKSKVKHIQVPESGELNQEAVFVFDRHDIESGTNISDYTEIDRYDCYIYAYNILGQSTGLYYFTENPDSTTPDACIVKSGTDFVDHVEGTIEHN